MLSFGATGLLATGFATGWGSGVVIGDPCSWLLDACVDDARVDTCAHFWDKARYALAKLHNGRDVAVGLLVYAVVDNFDYKYSTSIFFALCM